MLYVKLEKAVPVAVKHHTELDQAVDVFAFNPETGKVGVNGWISQSDIGSFQYASTIAEILTQKLGTQYLPFDEGAGCYPRFGIIEVPKVGDPVSRSFNGDSYPAGVIVKITPTWQIITSTGVKFRRFRETGGWLSGGIWWMANGHIDERNPHI